MLKKFLVLFLCLAFIFVGFEAKAFTSSMVEVHPIGTDYVYSENFDFLVMDFTIPCDVMGGDVLETITVQNIGTAGLSQIDQVQLWSDEGPEGFQGMGIDNLIINGDWKNEINGWLFDYIYEFISVDGLRLFVVITTKKNIATNKSFKFRIPMLTDFNEDGIYDPGDLGIFTALGVNGPTENVVMGNDQLSTRGNQDPLGPKVNITNLFDNDTYSANSYLIEGMAKDQGGANVEIVQISITQQGEADTWMDVTGIEPYFLTWKYDWSNIAPGEYIIKTKSKDSRGTWSEQEPITVNITSSDSLPYENSTIIPDWIIGTVGEDMGVTVTVLDENENPVSGKHIELISTKGHFDDIYYVDSQQTNAMGEVQFIVNSKLVGLSLFFAKADGEFLKMPFWGIDFPVFGFVDFETYETQDGRLVKSPDFSTVYLLDAANVRHVFPNENIYFSWFDDFSNVETISVEELASYPLGHNVQYKPGSLFKLQSVPKVFLVGEGGELHWLETEEDASMLYGTDWAAEVDDLSDSFYPDYYEGQSFNYAQTMLEMLAVDFEDLEEYQKQSNQ